MEILSAQAWTPGTAEPHWVAGSGRLGDPRGSRPAISPRALVPSRPTHGAQPRGDAARAHRSGRGRRGQNFGTPRRDSERRTQSVSDSGSQSGSPSRQSAQTVHVTGRVQTAPPTSVCSALISPPPAGSRDWGELAVPEVRLRAGKWRAEGARA